MLDIMTLMMSMKLQSEMKQLRKETRGEEETKPEEPQEPSAIERFIEQAQSTPFGAALCEVANETAAAIALESPSDESGETATSGWFDFPISIDLTVPKAPIKSA